MIKKITNEFKRAISGLKGIYSLTPVGSLKKETSLSLVNDIDYQLVAENVTDELMKKLHSFLSSVQSKDFIIKYAIEAGPKKPEPSKSGKPILFLHVALNTVKTWENIPKITKYTLQQNKPTLGKSLLSIEPIKKVSIADVIDCNQKMQGIGTCKKLIINKKIRYVTWKKIKNDIWKMAFHTERCSLRQREENCYYSILNSTANAISAISGKYTPIESLTKKCGLIGMKNTGSFISEAIKSKKQSRNRKQNLKLNELKSLEKKTLEYLNNLQKTLILMQK